MKEIRKPDAALTRLLPPVALCPDTAYVPSRFVLSFTHRGKNYVFNNLTKQCLEGTLPSSVKAGEGFDGLIAARFLVPAEKDECAFYSQISSVMRIYSRKKGIRSYTILPTLSCNARCFYCYEEGMPQTAMSPETIEQTVRFILETRGGKSVFLKWFGGEPMLGEGMIDRICSALREAGCAFTSSMVSNGSLITPGRIGKMKRDWNLTSVQLSLDGAEDDYIRRKNYPVYADAYRRVMQAADGMSAAGIQVVLRCNVDMENWPGVPRLLQDLKAAVPHKNRVSVYFCPLNAVRWSGESAAMWEKILEAGKWVREAGFRSVPYMGLNLGFRAFHCMADAGNVVITPDGGLFPCEHCPPESRFGDVFRGVTDEDARREFCRVDRVRDKCIRCPFLPDCTSFAACPAEERDCRRVRELMTLSALRVLVDRREEEGGENPIC